MRKVHFAFLALASWLVGSALSSVTEGALQPSPQWRTVHEDPLTLRRAAGVRRALSAARLTSLLGLPPPSARAAAEPPPKLATPSPLVLLGTLAPAFAAVFDPVETRVRTVSVGDVLHDDEILAIDHRSITLRREGQALELRMQQAPAGPAPSPPRARPLTSLSRAELDGALDNLPVLASQIQLHPDFSNRQFQGFRVARLQEDSLLARAGLRQGDLLRRVNGLDVWRPESLGKLLASAHAVTQVDVELDRDGARLRWSLPLTP
jgi:general secretion pathway protein C